ncbi:MAG: polyprenyl diphosphate synthase [Alphaproteobacteria bacterium]
MTYQDKIKHIAFIMDGNGRWAKQRGKPRIEGHRKGAAALRGVIEAAADLSIPFVTFFGFSTENWQRPPQEVQDLMGLLRQYLMYEVNAFHKAGAKLIIIGQRDRFSADLIELIEKAETKTKDNDKITVVIALNYGARAELLHAAKEICKQAVAGDISMDDLQEQDISNLLWTRDIPDPDLLIRTSGEQRISNFLLWQLAYSELLFMDCLWPDFSKAHLQTAMDEFYRRNRRFGLVEENPPA